MTNLGTQYLGLKLKNPLVASASSLSKNVDNIKNMEDAKLGAVVLYSLFEEEIVNESLALDHFLSRGTESFAEALTYFPEFDEYNTGKDRYLDLIREAKDSVDIPVIGSLNGMTNGGWIEYAKLIEEAGADALELNIYFVAAEMDVEAETIEKSYLELIKAVADSVNIPVAVKISPFHTSTANFASKIEAAGAKGLVMFNRFYQPDLDIEKLTVEPHLELSRPSDLLLPLRWTAILYGRTGLDLALTSGVHSSVEIVKALMAGASAVMTASELVKNGIPRAAQMLAEFEDWMSDHDYESVDALKGVLSQKSTAHPAAYERANYMKALTLFDE